MNCVPDANGEELDNACKGIAIDDDRTSSYLDTESSDDSSCSLQLELRLQDQHVESVTERATC